ncbi:uncharacterized protein LOC116286593 [Actinia tenebrosa]|uniref:Uncharacterized protein LOC116286593 n=1 Tax=Actinia tenebrosa TaxID=6105 RepID=A0A6P8GXP5_ACTTE|nr:uncharacterized protein LOC116286593 [Actinia tenebrosa]
MPGRSDPWYGRLGNESKKSWCATTLDINQFLQIDYGPNLRRFTGIVTQGSHNYDHWVTSYTLSHSMDGNNWIQYKESGVEKVFTGNNDRTTNVYHLLNKSINATFLRFHPKTWNVEICMRVEAYGCDAFSQPLGLENGNVPDANMRSRSDVSYEYAKYARLNNVKALRASVTNLEFLEINLGETLKVITAVATQGHGSRKEWIKEYSLSYSLEAAEWFNCMEHGEEKMFVGNSDQHTVVKHVLTHNITALLVRFHFIQYYFYPSIRVELYGGEVCSDPFGMENNQIPDSSISATANSGIGKEAKNARLNNAAAWCGVTNQDYLQIDLGRVRKLHKVATQGHPSLKQWVTKFAFHYSLDNVHWYQYERTEDVKQFTANTDQKTIVYTKLNKIRQARYVRFQPITWNTGACMRVEIYGCEDCIEPLGAERGLIPDSALTASSWYDIDHEPWLGRLYETRGEKAWCAKTNDGNQYLQVDLGYLSRVTGVATQGRNRHSWWGLKQPAWVTAYKLSLSNHTVVWTVYQEDGANDKVFIGNLASYDVVRHPLINQKVTRYLRFIPTTWEIWTCMRVEIYGCKDCDYPLGMEFYHIKREAILESSGKYLSRSLQTGIPRSARLNFDNVHGWVSATSKEHVFLEIDLGVERVSVTAVASQGDGVKERGVYEYALSFSTDRLDWFDYREEWQTKVFKASKSRYQATKRYLKQPVITRYVRFWPKLYIELVIMRVEVFGCRGCSQLLSLLAPSVIDSTKFFTGSNTSMVSWNQQVRLNDAEPANTWCGSGKDGEFFRLNFGTLKEVRSIYIQGHPTDAKWVKEISMRYSTDGIFFKTYSGYYHKKVFEANTDNQNITVVNLSPKLVALILDIYPKTWNNIPCMRIEVYGDQDCFDPIGMENHLVPNEAITATGWISVDHNPSQARLKNIHGQGAWCSHVNDAHQFLEIKLSRLHHITRVATQGRYPVPGCEVGDAWVTQYSIEYSKDGFSWQFYQENGVNKVFTANQEMINVVSNDFLNPILAIKVRIRPVQWNRKICLRVELYGCKGFFSPVGMENNDIPDGNIMGEVHEERKHYRLNLPYQPKLTGSSYTQDGTDHFVRITFGYIPFMVTGIAMQGRNNEDQYVINYVLLFSRDLGEWFNYVEDGETKVLSAAKYDDNIGIVVKQFRYEVKARAAKVIIKLFSRIPAFRVEFYGYPVDNAALGMSSGAIPDSAITASSFKTGYEPNKARLKATGHDNWCADEPIVNEFIKVGIGRMVVVTEIALGGGLQNGDGRVSKYTVSHSVDGKIWEVYHGEEELYNEGFLMANNALEGEKKTLRFPFRARYVKVIPNTFHGPVPCLTLELYGKEDCEDMVGVSDWKIPKTAMTASSSISGNYPPWMARLGSSDFGGAWCARLNDANQFLQVDLLSKHKITKIKIQGKGSQTDLPTIPESWVKTFTLSYSDDGFSWQDVLEGEIVKIFSGNTNGYRIETVTINTEVKGRFIRIHPKTWQNHICLRIELLGCEECGDPLGMENYNIPLRNIEASTDSGNLPSSRLNRSGPSKYFCILSTTNDDFLQINVGRAAKGISAVAVQGRFCCETFIQEFLFKYSRDGINYVTYKFNGKDKILKGPVGEHEMIRHRFERRIVATHVRIVILEYQAAICLQAELYGCEACSESRGFGHHRITSYTLSASSNGASVSDAEVSSLNSAWCAASDDSNPYLQAQFTSSQVITKIVTMGHPVNGQYVSKYKITYSTDGVTWKTHYEDESETVVSEYINRERSLAEGHFHELQFPIEAKYIKIGIIPAVGRCMKVAFYGHDVCNSDLGMEDSRIPDSALTASSSRGHQFSPANARLNHHLGQGAWCSKENTSGQYLQIDLGLLYRVKGVALQAKTKTQSLNDTKAWVKKFTLKYSRDGGQWNEYFENGILMEFPGITKAYQTVKKDLKNEVVTRFVRIVAKEWESRICMRVELYGCKACSEPLGMENYQIPESQLASTHKAETHGRLGNHRKDRWYSANSAPEPYFQINLGKKKVVTAVATQGRRTGLSIKLHEYNIQYSDDGSSWANYTENQVVKGFAGYTTQQEIVQQYLPYNITTQYIRFLPKVWVKSIELKTEVYGCEVSP